MERDSLSLLCCSTWIVFDGGFNESADIPVLPLGSSVENIIKLVIRVHRNADTPARSLGLCVKNVIKLTSRHLHRRCVLARQGISRCRSRR